MRLTPCSTDSYPVGECAIEYLGCFNDVPDDSAIPGDLVIVNPATAVEECEKVTAQQGYNVFGIRDGVNCYTTSIAELTYPAYGAADQDCVPNNEYHYTLSVYKINCR